MLRVRILEYGICISYSLSDKGNSRESNILALRERKRSCVSRLESLLDADDSRTIEQYWSCCDGGGISNDGSAITAGRSSSPARNCALRTSFMELVADMRKRFMQLSVTPMVRNALCSSTTDRTKI